MKFRNSTRRIYSARFYRHNGNADVHGNPTYAIPEDWAALPGRFPCECIDTTGGETIRGRQVTEQTTHVLFGEFYSCDQVQPIDQCRLSDGRQFQVVYMGDSKGTRQERRVELRFEQ